MSDFIVSAFMSLSINQWLIFNYTFKYESITCAKLVKVFFVLYWCHLGLGLTLDFTLSKKVKRICATQSWESSSCSPQMLQENFSTSLAKLQNKSEKTYKSSGKKMCSNITWTFWISSKEAWKRKRKVLTAAAGISAAGEYGC